MSVPFELDDDEYTVQVFTEPEAVVFEAEGYAREAVDPTPIIDGSGYTQGDQ